MDKEGLEQACIRPGLWMIEGIRVERQWYMSVGIRWLITWEEPAVRNETVRTLDDARGRIVDEINAGRL